MTDGRPANDRFEALLAETRPPTGGVALEDIAAEVGPVLPLLRELPAHERAGGDFESFECRECFTVLTLLGRRLALLDLTAASVLQVADLALRSIDPPGASPAEGFHQRATMATVEGFVLGREERVARDAEARALATIRPLRIGTSTFAVLIAGVRDPRALSEVVESLGRSMLDATASWAIVDLTHRGEPSRERARAIFSAEEVTRMLGARCIFSGVDPRWRRAAAEGRIHLDELYVVPTFAAALTTAQTLAAESRASGNPKWRALLDRLRR